MQGCGSPCQKQLPFYISGYKTNKILVMLESATNKNVQPTPRRDRWKRRKRRVGNTTQIRRWWVASKVSHRRGRNSTTTQATEIILKNGRTQCPEFPEVSFGNHKPTSLVPRGRPSEDALKCPFTSKEKFCT